MDWKGKRVVVFGATSAIVSAVCRELAQRGASMVLVGRNAEKLSAVSDDIKTFGGDDIYTEVSDLNDFSKHKALIDSAETKLGGIDVVLIGHGLLGDSKEVLRNFDAAHEVLKTNMISVISLLTYLANYFEGKGDGVIAVITSVAGDRGRKGNYVYGASKGGLSIFLQGLRNRLYEKGVAVVDIRPGFVDTPMTAQFKKGILFAKPDKVARGIVKAMEDKRDIYYVPAFWRIIMFVIKAIPEGIFKRLSI